MGRAASLSVGCFLVVAFVAQVCAGTATEFQILLPGQTATPGVAPGKTDSPSVQTAGAPFLVTVSALDSDWNPADSTATVRLTSDDIYASSVSDQILQNGSTVFSLILVTGNAGELDVSNRYTILTASDVTNPPSQSPLAFSTAAVPVTAAPDAVYLLLLMPGQTHAPGRPPYAPTDEGWYPGGASGAPSSWLAGTTYYVTVAACDKYWNINSAHNPLVTVAHTDTYGSVPAAMPLEGGKYSFAFSMRKATLYQGVLNDRTTVQVTADGYYISRSSINVLPADDVPPLAKFLILAPGQTHQPGSSTGKSGSPAAQQAGSWFPVRVLGTDRYNNIISTMQPGVTLRTPGDPNDDTAGGLPQYSWDPIYQPLINGSTIFNITLVTANTSHYLHAEDTDGNGYYYGNTTSDWIPVTPGPATKLQVLLPGEAPAPGSPTGKTGGPTNRIAGAPFTLTVNLVDDNWNRATTGDDLVSLASTDVYWSTPTAHPLSGGTCNFNAILKTAATHTITATGGGYDAGVSSPVVVEPNFPDRLLVILPGQTQVNGKNTTPAGRSGSPTPQTAGKTFSATAAICDFYYNIVPGAPVTVMMTTSVDLFDTHPPPDDINILTGMKSFNFTLFSPATYHYISAYDVDYMPPTYSPGNSSEFAVEP